MKRRTSHRAKRARSFDWKAVGHRMRVTRIALGISENEAATAHDVTVNTYRRYEAGVKQRASNGWLQFCERFDISLDYYLHGGTHNMGQHLSINRGGKVSILPAITPHERQQLAKFGPTIGTHARYRISSFRH